MHSLLSPHKSVPILQDYMSLIAPHTIVSKTNQLLFPFSEWGQKHPTALIFEDFNLLEAVTAKGTRMRR